MKISFLIHNVYGVGGTNRAVINLASALADRHDVEIVSAFRRLDEPMLDIPEAVRVVGLVDLRTGAPDRDHPEQRQRSAIVPGDEEFYSAYSRLTDARLRHYLQTSGRDVFIGTRPALNLAVATWGPDDAVLIAQEHQTHATLPDSLRAAMRDSYSRLAAAVTVTETDAAAFRALTPVPGLTVCAVPNSSPLPPLPPGDTAGKIIIAAGRLDQVKRYDLLLHAFRGVADEYPDWSLRIYGAGPESGALRNLISALDLADRVLLMGRHAHLETEWVKAAMLVSSSERESFGMSIVEAMQAGLPVVSTRAPVGPEEIITHGEDGLLVPVDDVAALRAAITKLVDDPELRQLMGERARQNATRFVPSRVASQYEALFDQLRSRGRARQGLASSAMRWGGAVPVRARAAVHSLASHLPWLGAASLPTPVVHVTLGRDGGLSFRSDALASGCRRLVLVHREDGAEVPVELTQLRSVAEAAGRSPADAGTVRRTAVLPSSTVLPEGRWNVYAEYSDGSRLRAVAGVCDTRQAVGMDLGSVTGPVARRLPYETADRFLGVRTWLRYDHAEIDRVEPVEGILHLRGRLAVGNGTDFAGDLRLVARSRLDGGSELVMEPVPPSGPGRFDLVLDLDALAAQRVTRHDDWDLYVEGVSSGVRARVARLGDDIADRKSVFHYPFTRCEVETDPLMSEISPAPTVQVRPYITVDSDLSLFVRER